MKIETDSPSEVLNHPLITFGTGLADLKGERTSIDLTDPEQRNDDNDINVYESPQIGHLKDVFIGEKKAGVLYSSVYNVGMAQLRLEFVKKTDILRVGDYIFYPFRPLYLSSALME